VISSKPLQNVRKSVAQAASLRLRPRYILDDGFLSLGIRGACKMSHGLSQFASVLVNLVQNAGEVFDHLPTEIT
jgi:hypothetical protein